MGSAFSRVTVAMPELARGFRHPVCNRMALRRIAVVMKALLSALIVAILTLQAMAQDEQPSPPSAAIPLPRERPEPAPPAPAPLAPDADPTAAPAEPPAERVYQTACPALLDGQIEARALPPIAEGACVARSPLSVTSVAANGRFVPFSGDAILTCGMAAAVADWVAAIDGYLQARENTGLAAIITGTSYACRNRNNAEDGFLSEHGFANALDVIGFVLEDGRTLSLPEGWSPPLSPAGRLLRFAHDQACTNFTTTLGPESNAAHADHLHVDLGCHGARCTARLCE